MTISLEQRLADAERDLITARNENLDLTRVSEQLTAKQKEITKTNARLEREINKLRRQTNQYEQHEDTHSIPPSTTIKKKKNNKQMRIAKKADSSAQNRFAALALD